METIPNTYGSTPQPASPAGVTAPQPGVFPPRESMPHIDDIQSVTTLAKPWDAIFAIVAALIALLGIFVIYFLNVATSAQIRQADQTIGQLTTALNTEPLLSTKQQVQRLSVALTGYQQANSQKYNYGPFNEQLASITPKEVLVNALSLDEKGVLRLTATATNFVNAGKALLAFRQSAMLSGVTLDSVAMTSNDNRQQINFTLLATLRPEFLGANGTTNQPNGSVVPQNQ